MNPDVAAVRGQFGPARAAARSAEDIARSDRQVIGGAQHQVACSGDVEVTSCPRAGQFGPTQDHLAAGKLPTRLAMTFDDRVSFILTEKMEIKRVAFLDVIKEEAEKQADAADMQMEADFALMTGELSRLIPALVEVLGGEVEAL